MNRRTAGGPAPELLAGLWAKVLGVGHLGADDAVADFGAELSDAVRVAARLRQQSGVQAPLRTVLAAATPRALANALSGLAGTDGSDREAGGEAAALGYWRTQLAGSTQLDLPADRPRPPVRAKVDATHDFVIDTGLADGVRVLAGVAGATPALVLLSGWVALLGRLGDTGDVAVGVCLLDRRRPEPERSVGGVTGPVVVRTSLATRCAASDLVAQVRDTTLDALVHRELPFERLVTELAPDHADSHHPLFTVHFVHQPRPAADELVTDELAADLAVPQLPASATAGDLGLAVWDRPDGTLHCTLRYRTALFDQATVERIGGYYQRLLTGLTATPDATVDEVDLLGPAERGRLVAVATGTTAALPGHCLHTAVDTWVRQTPTAVAVACGGVELTYAELDARANRIAHYLRGHGVGPEAGVAVRLPRSVDQVVAMLAVWKAGGYYVPLDDEHPAERIALMLADAAPLVLITRGAERIASGESAGGLKVVCLDRDVADIAAQPSTAPTGVGVGQHDLAAAIYTSGSTGTPKAVALTHGNVLSAEVSRADLGASPASLLLPVSFAFDVFLSFAAWALCAGGRVVVPVQPRGADLDELAGLLRTQRVTHLIGPPDLQRALLARDDVVGNDLAIGVVGGQSCPRLLAEDYARATRGARLVNEYSATETSAGTYFVSDGRDLATVTAGQLPIGRPVANYSVHLLDASFAPVPDGVVAEVFIGGPGVARGYLRRPGLTAERFLPDPFAAEPGARLYRTGDLARRRSDGQLEFRGRRDRQVKVRGHRIEPAEIEAALLRHPGVAAAAVVLLPQRQELAGYVVAAPETAGVPTAEELRGHLKRLLPDPMVPTSFAVLDALPLTPNGKVDRAALAELDGAEPEPEVSRTAPRTPAELAVAQVWAELLTVDVDSIDVDADFFQIGGHSLLAAGVVSRLRASFPVPIDMRDLFGSPTVAGLAELIGARMMEALRSQFGQLPATTGSTPGATTGAAAEPVESETAIVRRDHDGPVALSAGQEQLWLVDRIESGSRAYQMPVAARLVGELDVDALRAAVDALVRRHEVLRTRIDLVDDVPRQIVDPPRPVPLPITEGTSAGLLAQLEELAARRFDLAADLMLRADLIRLAATEHVLLLVVHHIAADAESVQLLVDELAVLYADHTAGREPTLPPPPLQYADYAAWYGARRDGARQRAQLDYWAAQLDGVVPLALPTDRPSRAGSGQAGSRCEFDIDPGLSTRARAVAAEYGATPFMVMLAVFKVLLTRVGAGTDVVVGVPVSGRSRPELAELVGFLGNTIALRTELDGAVTFADVLGRVRQVTADGLANQEVAFARVIEQVAPERTEASTPLFSVMFTYEHPNPPLPPLGDLVVTEVTLPSRTTQFDLMLRLIERPDGSLVGYLDYATSLFDEATARRLHQWYGRLLGALLPDPLVPVESVALLTDGPSGDVARLTAWNATHRDYQLAPLNRMLAEQARRTPDAPAVWSDGQWATYAEFTSEVHRLAAHLRGRGIGVEDVVGICLPRGRHLVTAVHAVVTAGAAYLPLPPDLPASRLALMTDDACPAAVITTSEFAASVAGVPLVLLDDPAVAAAEPAGPLDVDVPLDALAYVIFTSGSTGRPKGVGVSHRAIANRLVWMQETFAIDAGDRVLHKTPFSFDVSVWELFWPLLTGAGLVIAHEGAHRDFDQLAALVSATDVTTCHFVPSIMALFLDDLAAEAPGRLPSLRRVVCSGEALTADLVGRFQALLPGVQLHNLYGPTEAAVDVSWHPCDGSDLVVPIGRPVANTRLEVLDGSGRRVPVGVPGELYLGGVQLARGYLGRPGLTAQRFIPDPHADQPGQRLYRTGDLARWRHDGTVEYLGRVDHQVKIRGVRIEPAEIETALRGHPAVGGAVVLAWHPPGGEARLVAYVTASGVDVPRANALREHLGAVLPPAMVPSRFIVLPELPLTASGKLDRRALPEPTLTVDQDAEPVAPRTPDEALIAQTWCAVLGQAQPAGVFDDFFEHGGNSIHAVRLVARLRSAGLAVSVQDIFVHRTIAALAARVAEGSQHPERALVWLRRGGAAAPLFCVHPGDGSAHWFTDLATDLGGAAAVAAFEWPGLRGEHVRPGSVAEVAGRYVAELREASPVGPYRLLGWCGGAAVAWDMARQLTDAGQQVQLYLLDPVIDVADRANFRDQLAQFERCEQLFAALATEGDAPTAVRLRADIVAILGQAIDNPEVSVCDDDINAEWRNRLSGWRQLLEANIDYQFPPYDGHLVLLLGEEVRSEEHLVLYGLGYQGYVDRWRELAGGGVQTRELPGDHYGVLRRPNVTALAEILAGTNHEEQS